MPDSKRCLEPTLAPEELLYVPKRNSSVQKNPGSFETLINRTDNQSSITNCRKTPNKKMYKSFVIGEEVNELPQQKKHTKSSLNNLGMVNLNTMIILLKLHLYLEE